MAVPNPAWRPDTESNPRKGAFNRPEGLQRMFLMRMRRLTWLRRSCSSQLEVNVLRVLDKAIYSTYCDCMELGVDEEAREFLKQAA